MTLQELNDAVPGRPTLCVGGADRKLPGCHKRRAQGVGVHESMSHVVDVSCEGYDQPPELQNR